MQQYRTGARILRLGMLEATVMEILWRDGEANVHDVTDSLDRRLAYTTIMTTLDRLFKKGLLVRRKLDRAFIYGTAITRQEWYRKRVADFVADFRSDAILVSCLVDAMGEHGTALLNAVEDKIRLKRATIM